MSIHPDHYFPNIAPKGYFLIDNSYHLLPTDRYWDLSTDIWYTIPWREVGNTDTRYMRLARLLRNTIVNRAKEAKIDWQPMKTANMGCVPLLLKRGKEIVMGRCLNYGRNYISRGWFIDEVTRAGEFWTSEKLFKPTAWASIEPFR